MTTTVHGHDKKVWDEATLTALPEDGYIHEVVNGELVMSPKNTFEHGQICARLLTALLSHVTENKLGVVLDSSTGFWMKNENCRAPDISFISRDRLRGLTQPPRAFFRGAPDLAVEILPRSNSPSEVNDRLKDYFESGARLAWVVHPVERFAEICHSPTDRSLAGSEGNLEGGDVVQGFSYLIAKLFEPWDWE